MNTHRLLLTLAIGALVLAACGSDGDGGGSAEGAQAEAARRTIDEAAADGVELDEGCVNDVASKLSDEDAEAIAAGNNSAISEAGQALSMELIACADAEAIANMFIEGMSQSGQEFDEGCVRDMLSEFDISELVAVSEDGAPPAELITAMMKCMDFGG